MPDAPSPQPEPASDHPSRPSSPIDAPLRALQAFLKADSWKERSRWVLHAEEMAAPMALYHQNGPSDGPLATRSIDYLDTNRVPGSNLRLFLFLVSTDSVPTGFPVPVEETPDGFKIDWRPFVEFNDRLLEQFLSDPLASPATFHVILERTHHFSSEIPDAKQKKLFKIRCPIPGVETVATATTTALESAESQIMARWNTLTHAVVLLSWKHPDGSPPFVSVERVFHHSWRKDQAS